MPCKELRGRYCNVPVLQFNVPGYKELAFACSAPTLVPSIRFVNVPYRSLDNDSNDGADDFLSEVTSTSSETATVSTEAN